MADDATERLLKEQARAHGLEAYAPEPEGVAPKTIAYAIRQDAERDEAALRGFAGLRGGASSSFEIGAQWSAAPAPPVPVPIGLDLTAFESVEALAGDQRLRNRLHLIPGRGFRGRAPCPGPVV